MDIHVSLQDVGKIYRGPVDVQALVNTNLEIVRGSVVALLGPSGSGKTTLLHLIGGLTQPSRGAVRVDGVEISELPSKDLSAYRRRKVGFVFQFFNLIDSLTIQENIHMGADGITPERIQELLKAVELEDKAQSFPATLSGGQQQRIAVARALAGDPALLLCDEPTGSLDHQSGRAVLDILQNESRVNGRTVLIVTHNHAVAQAADRILRMKDGRLVSDDQNEARDAKEIDW